MTTATQNTIASPGLPDPLLSFPAALGGIAGDTFADVYALQVSSLATATDSAPGLEIAGSASGLPGSKQPGKAGVTAEIVKDLGKKNGTAQINLLPVLTGMPTPTALSVSPQILNCTQPVNLDVNNLENSATDSDLSNLGISTASLRSSGLAFASQPVPDASTNPGSVHRLEIPSALAGTATNASATAPSPTLDPQPFGWQTSEMSPPTPQAVTMLTVVRSQSTIQNKTADSIASANAGVKSEFTTEIPDSTPASVEMTPAPSLGAAQDANLDMLDSASPSPAPGTPIAQNDQSTMAPPVPVPTTPQSSSPTQAQPAVFPARNPSPAVQPVQPEKAASQAALSDPTAVVMADLSAAVEGNIMNAATGYAASLHSDPQSSTTPSQRGSQFQSSGTGILASSALESAATTMPVNSVVLGTSHSFAPSNNSGSPHAAPTAPAGKPMQTNKNDTQEQNSSSGNAPSGNAAMPTAQPGMPISTGVPPAAVLADAAHQGSQSAITSSPSMPDSSHFAPSAEPTANSQLPAQALPFSASSPVQLAQMLNRAAQSEMRIGLNTSAFGSVEVRTTLHANDVGVLIGSEKGDLRSLLASELPGIVHTLQQQNVRLNEVAFQQGLGFANQSSSGGNSQPRGFFSRPTDSSAFAAEAGNAESAEPPEPSSSATHFGFSILA